MKRSLPILVLRLGSTQILKRVNHTEGIHVEDQTTMVVSRGLGNSIIPVRIFNFPEIVYVELMTD